MKDTLVFPVWPAPKTSPLETAPHKPAQRGSDDWPMKQVWRETKEAPNPEGLGRMSLGTEPWLEEAGSASGCSASIESGSERCRTPAGMASGCSVSGGPCDTRTPQCCFGLAFPFPSPPLKSTVIYTASLPHKFYWNVKQE